MEDRNKNARHGGRAKNQHDPKSSPSAHGDQRPRLPTPTTLKGRIDPAAFYGREIPNAPRLRADADGWSQNFHCSFPEHEDSTGSFGVNLKTGAYRCFGCGHAGGSVVDYAMDRDGLTLDQVRADLAERYGVEPDATPTSPRSDRPDPAPSLRSQVPALATIPPHALAKRPAVHPKHGAPSAVWTYTDATGCPVGYVCRFDPPQGRKVFAPLTWTPATGWQWRAVPAPRPVYGLARLTDRAAAPVLICEGEKAADAAAELLPDYACIASWGGAQAARQTDWGPLAGRAVRIWPDADAPGESYARSVAELAQAAGAASVEILDLAALARDPGTGEARALPKGWDAADARADGWASETLAAAVRWRPVGLEPKPEARPDPAPGSKPEPADGTALPFGFELRERGIYWTRPGGQGGNGDVGADKAVFVCPPLKVLAVTRDPRGDDFGRLVEFADLDGNPRQGVILDRERQGSGDALRARLAMLGFEVGTHPEARRWFLDLLRRWHPAARARSTTRTGWEGGAYVRPDRVIGNGAEPVVLAPEGEPAAFGCRGTLDDWRRTLGAYSASNSRLAFCVSLAFAAPLLHLIGAESGGFHLRGDSTEASSTGKTTAQRVAASVCAAPDFLQRWRTTDNALEVVAESHNDALLTLDELNQMDPKAAGEAAYMLANGVGKARMDRNAGGRPVKRWRLLFLSSGEIGLAEHMATAQRRVRAGQEVRMVEIPADAGRGFGVFEDLHGFPDGAAFSLALTDAAAAYFGTPLVAFLEATIRQRAELPAAIRMHRDAFVSRVLTGIANPSGQVRRVAARFGLVAVAGELATGEGITGWSPGTAFDAAARCFGDWLAARGGAVPAEERDLVGQVRHWFERHANRFRWRARALDDHAPEVPHQAGFKDMTPDGTGGIVFYAFAETFAREIVEGYSASDAARVLARRGLLKPGGDGRPSQKVRLPGFAKPVRVYVFTSDMGAADGPESGEAVPDGS